MASSPDSDYIPPGLLSPSPPPRSRSPSSAPATSPNTSNDNNNAASSSSTLTKTTTFTTNVISVIEHTTAPPKPLSTSTSKPKSKSKPAPRPRSRSPSPVLPPPLPPLQTIRLTFTLGGPDNYEVDISARAKETGQRADTPEVVREKRRAMDTSDSEGEEEQGKKKRRKKKKVAEKDYYDVDDPFIDDSELAIDERTYFAQTKQKGFYVSSGEVALMRDKPSPKRPKSSAGALTNGKSTSTTSGPHSVPNRSSKSAVTPAPPLLSSSSKGLGFLTMSNATPRLSTLLDVGDKLRQANASRLSLNISSSANGNRAASGSRDGTPGSGSRVPSPVTMKNPNHNTDEDWVMDEPTPAPSKAGGASTLDADSSLELGPDPDSVRLALLQNLSGAGVPEKKEKKYVWIVDPKDGKKKKIVDLSGFFDEVRRDAEEMKVLVDTAEWEKGKFPPHLKDPLTEMAVRAMRMDEYDDHFFNMLPQIFPYNRFTMMKLTKRLVFPRHIELLHEAQDNLLVLLEKETKAGFATAQEEYDKAMAAWDRKQERLKAEPATATLTPASQTHAHDSDSAMPSDSGGPGKDDAAKAGMSVYAVPGGNGIPTINPPVKKYRMTDTIKGIVWQLVQLSNECVRLENERNKFEGTNQIVSEQGGRKVLYQKIVAAFPEGWMTSSQISRDVSALKKRLEKETMDTS